MDLSPNDVNACLKLLLFEEGPSSRNQALNSMALATFQSSELNVGFWVLELGLVFIGINSLRSFVNLEGIFACLNGGDFEEDALKLGIFGRFVDVGSIIINLRNSQGSELCNEVIVGHEKYSVVLVWVKVNSLLFALVYVLPVLIMIRPSSREFTLSPRIPQLHNSFLLTPNIQMGCIQKCVCVSLNNTTHTLIRV